MSSLKTILVTGGAGYVGAVLVPKLLAAGYRVRVLDLFLFGSDVLDGTRPNLELIRGDLRDRGLLERVLPGCDAVIHLACISNDPSFELDPELGKSINYDCFRPLVRAIREGYLFYYLPDQDFGPRDSVFVPFFGVPAATITALGRLARLANATVVPAVTRQLPGAAGYCTTLHPPWQDFPSGDDERDARRMNEFIEQRVLEMPEQYWWVHRRFKTRPPGEPSPY